MKRRHIKLLSVLLMLVLIISSIPVTTVAQGLTLDNDSKKLPSVWEPFEITPNPDYQENSDISEIVERREENVKHFRHSDGSVEAIVYGYAVHRKDENGVWQDIDNRLFSETAAENTSYSTVDKRVTFSKDAANSGNLLTLCENGYIISMGYINPNAANTNDLDIPVSEEIITASEAEVIVTNHRTRTEQIVSISANISGDEKLEQLKTIDNESSIVYKNIQNGVSLEYVLQSNDLKENIIINQVQQEYVYTFILRVSGLYAELRNDGSIVLIDTNTGESPYYIPSPFMYDSDGNISDAVSYDLELIENGLYILTVSADSEWINQSSRAFPVVVDPTLQQSILFDTYINSSASTTNYGSSSQLWIGTTTTSYIRAALTSIPAGSTIDTATFNVAFYYYSTVTDGTLNVGVYKVLNSWSEYGLTWNIANQYNNLGLDTTRISYRTFRGDAGAYSSSPKWVSFLVTSAVQSWADGSANYGLALKRESGTNNDVIVYSYEAGTTYRPYFIVLYKEPVITEGVYRLKSVYNGLYLTTGGTSYLSGATIQQSASKGSSDLTQLFKITYIQDYGNDRCYDIRPMTNSALGLYAPLASSSTHNVTANSMATTDGWFDIPETQRWTIQTNASSGYVTLLNAFSDNGGYLSTPTNSTSGAAIVTTTTLGTNCRWILEPYTGESINGIIGIGIQETLAVGDSVTYRTYMYSSTVGCNGPVIYSVSNLDGSNTDNATVDASTGYLTALKSGRIKLTVRYTGSPTTWYWIISIDCKVIDGIPTSLRSNSNHLCIPCAITNVAAYWCNTNNLTQFGCGASATQESRATEVQNKMNEVGSCQANDYIQDGFSVFSHVNSSITYTLQATNCWASNNAFDWDSIIAEIDSGRPVMLGFSGFGDSPYSAHMTVCVGYKIDNGVRYVYLSDAHESGYVEKVFDESYNDFIAKVIVLSR